MTLRAKFWWTVAAVSVFVNAGGAVFALRDHEWPHGGVHVALLALTLYLVQRLRPRAALTAGEGVEPISDWTAEERARPVSLGEVRLEQLQQSVDAIALEVERIGEAQRYSAKLTARQDEGTGERR